MSSNSFYSGVKFYDNTNFPYDFSRSGDFTFQEAGLLTNCGYIMQQLDKKQMQPENEEQIHFIGVIEGKNKPLYGYEHVYLKYLSLIEKNNNPICNIQKVTRNFDNYVFDEV